ncbi:MAG: Transporter [Acidimicrobiales bacterium]|jgi:hypothetical protein|nr:Transporter [Acidimicrobiales bacterium]
MRRFLTILTLSTIAALPLAPPAHAGADPAAAETQFAQILNSQRASAGLAPLSLDPALSTLARGWSDSVAASGNLVHNPNLGGAISSIVPGWTRYGENIAYGQTPQQMSDMLWNSAPHKANIMGGYNRVGVGVAVSGSTLWVTFDFVQGPPIATVPMLAGCSTPGYVLDGFGGVHSVGGAPTVGVSAYWLGWDIARDLSLTPGHKGYVLDGFGGLHPTGGAPSIPVSAYWSGWDIARAVAVTPDGNGAYVLDGWGGVHQAGAAPAAPGSASWTGWDIARDIQVDPTTGNRGYVLDGFGGLHPFGAMPAANVSAYYPFAVARSFTMLPDGTGGYVTDLFGGLHPFAVGGNAMPPVLPTLATLPGPTATGSIVNGTTGAVVTTTGSQVGVNAACVNGSMFPWGIARAVAQ